MLVLRSGIFSALLWLGVLVYAPIVVAFFFLPYRSRYWLITRFVHYHNWLLKTFCRLTYRVRGFEHLPAGGFVVLSKHQSTWETFALPTILPPFVYILKRDLLWIPFFGWGLALLRPIAINRRAGKRAMEQVVTQGRARLEAGLNVVVFPEGTRIAPRAPVRFKQGGAVLAAQTGYPVVPLAHNAGSYWPRRSFVKHPGTIDVVIGPAIATRDRTAGEVNREAEVWMEKAMQELESPAADRGSRPSPLRNRR